jgi:hypothetical protein
MKTGHFYFALTKIFFTIVKINKMYYSTVLNSKELRRLSWKTEKS